MSKFQEWLKENKNTTLDELLQVKENRSSPSEISKLYPSGYKRAQQTDAYWASVASSDVMANLAKKDKMVDGAGGVKGQFAKTGKKKKKKS